LDYERAEPGGSRSALRSGPAVRQIRPSAAPLVPAPAASLTFNSKIDAVSSHRTRAPPPVPEGRRTEVEKFGGNRLRRFPQRFGEGGDGVLPGFALKIFHGPFPSPARVLRPTAYACAVGRPAAVGRGPRARGLRVKISGLGNPIPKLKILDSAGGG